MATITLNEMTFFAHHGCFAEERITGNQFLVNAVIRTDIKKAAFSDKLLDTVDYQDIYLTIRHEMMQPSALLEHVAQRIIAALKKKFHQIQYVQIAVTKINPALGGKLKGVTVTTDSDELI